MAGAKVVLLEARMNSELANLVRRHGGEPVSVPAVRETTADCGPEVAALIDRLSAGELELVIFQTGVGVTTLIDEAERLARKAELVEALKRVTTVARGPKPTAALSRHGLKPNVVVREPFTTTELIEALQPLAISGKRIAVLHYGERNTALVETLAAGGASLQELCLYQWQLPEDPAPLRRLIDRIINREFTAIAFTSQIQARHLFQLAAEAGREAELKTSLNEQIVVSIGPTCSAVLRSLGVEPRVEPAHPKMGPMVLALADYLGRRP
jgi:uroporphyrinogen-III synthase